MIQVSDGQEYKICYLTWISRELKGEKEYAFLLVPADKTKALHDRIESMQEYSPTDYGIVIERGIGKPTDAVLQRMKKEFSFSIIQE